MSIVRTSSVFCDVTGPYCTGSVADTVDGADAARRWARNAGWIRRDGRDVCPACQFTNPVCADCGSDVGYYGRHGWAHTGAVRPCPHSGGDPTPVERAGTDA